MFVLFLSYFLEYYNQVFLGVLGWGATMDAHVIEGILYNPQGLTNVISVQVADASDAKTWRYRQLSWI